MFKLALVEPEHSKRWANARFLHFCGFFAASLDGWCGAQITPRAVVHGGCQAGDAEW